MRVRYTGPDDARDLAVAGGVIVCPRMKWVDVTKTAADTGIAEGHAEIVAREIVKQPDWELESVVKAVRTRKKNAAAAAEVTPEVVPEVVPELPASEPEPAQQDEEQQ